MRNIRTAGGIRAVRAPEGIFACVAHGCHTVVQERAHDMYIRVWGSRGSIPVCGPEFVRYGGDTTCIEIRSSSGELVVVDAGSGIRRLGEKLLQENVRRMTILFTHAHIDHIMGLPFFAPIYRKETRIAVYGRSGTAASYREVLKGIMSAPYCPVELETVEKGFEFNAIETSEFAIGTLRIRVIPLSHPNGGLGYRFEDDGKSFVFLTDNELDYCHPGGRPVEDYIRFADKADLLFHDAEYTASDYRQAWGHSTLESAVGMALRAGVKRLGLFHVNQRRTDDEMDAMVERAREIVRAGKGALKCFGVSNTWEIRLD